MNRKELDNLLMKKEELKSELYSVERELTDILLTFEGTVKDALILGLVRPNFATPSGFRRYLRDERERQR